MANRAAPLAGCLYSAGALIRLVFDTLLPGQHSETRKAKVAERGSLRPGLSLFVREARAGREPRDEGDWNGEGPRT
jgi:hypothetical protein